MKAAAILVAPGFAVGCSWTPLSEPNVAPIHTQTVPNADTPSQSDAPIALIDLSNALKGLSVDNPRLAADSARQDGVIAGVSVARGRQLPDLTFSAGYGVSRAERTTAGAVTRSENNPWNFNAEARLPLYAGGQLLSGVRAARAREAAGRYQSADTRQTVLLESAEAYLSLYRDERIAALRAENITLVNRLRAAAAAQFALGAVTRTDVALAEAQAGFSEAELAREDGRLAVSRAAFVRQFGYAPAGPLAAPGLRNDMLPATAEEAAFLAGQANPRLLGARKEAAAQAFTARAAMGGYLPAVNLVASHARGANEVLREEPTEDSRIALRVSVPLGAPAFGQARQARALAAQRRFESQDLERVVRQDAMAAFATHEAEHRRALLLAQRAEAAGRAALGVEREYQCGARSMLDLLQSQEQAVQARIDQDRATFDRLLPAYRLLAATGRLTPDMIG
jgi:outer membrane protein